jgi:hypothetical protein
MSRSGYTDGDDWSMIRWRGQVASATRGRRGQKFFRDLLVALEAMPEKKLISGNLISPDGSVCALGALGRERGRISTLVELDPEYCNDHLAGLFDVTHQLIAETEWVNDEVGRYDETPEMRWRRVHAWVESQIWDWTWE